jgi:hypothetical protein
MERQIVIIGVKICSDIHYGSPNKQLTNASLG